MSSRQPRLAITDVLTHLAERVERAGRVFLYLFAHAQRLVRALVTEGSPQGA